MKEETATRRDFLVGVSTVCLSGLTGCSLGGGDNNSTASQPSSTSDVSPTSVTTETHSSTDSRSDIPDVVGTHTHFAADAQFTSSHPDISGPKELTSRVWETSLENPQMPVLLHNNAVYVFDKGLGAIFARNATTGTRIWAAAIGGSVGSIIALTDSDLILRSGLSINRSDGTINWSRDMRIHLVTDGRVYGTTSTNGTDYVVMYDAASGSLKWELASDASKLTASAVGLHLLAGETIVTRDLETGDLIWETPGGDINTSLLGTREGALVYTAGLPSDTPQLVSVNTTTGESLWERPLSESAEFIIPYVERTSQVGTGYALTQTMVIYAALKSNASDFELVVQAHNLSDGSLLWEQKLPVEEDGRSLENIQGVNIMATSMGIYTAVGMSNRKRSQTYVLDQADGAISKKYSGFVSTITEKSVLSIGELRSQGFGITLRTRSESTTPN